MFLAYLSWKLGSLSWMLQSSDDPEAESEWSHAEKGWCGQSVIR